MLGVFQIVGDDGCTMLESGTISEGTLDCLVTPKRALASR